MPICTFCTQPIPYLYTVYESEYNLRLEQCPKCHEFVDPYVEHDSLTIWLDLILLKRGVYRHLLYNLWAEPRKLIGGSKKGKEKEESETHHILAPASRERVGGLVRLFVAAAFIGIVGALVACVATRQRISASGLVWTYLTLPSQSPITTPWTKELFLSFLHVFVGTLAETVAFHSGVMSTCYLLMKLITYVRSFQKADKAHYSNIRQEFRLSLIPLSLFYSSLTKLFLLVLLTIWLPATDAPPFASAPFPDWVEHVGGQHSFFGYVLRVLDDDRLDREWLIRNVLGGMSAGFGLRVILDIHPVFTTSLIVAGWAAKTGVATVVSHWIGRGGITGEAWLAYSIP